MRFFNGNSQYIGCKDTLKELLVAATGIEEIYFDNPDLVQTASVADHMRWCAGRQTTRDEDLAYCLLGLFDVNMPLLYGEGKKAFVRLQLEIIKDSDDESIFAWDSQRHGHSILASSPACFAINFESDIVAVSIVSRALNYRPPFAMTNKCLEFSLELPETVDTMSILLPLNCVQVTQYRDSPVRECQMAIRFTTLAIKENGVLRAYLFRGVILGKLKTSGNVEDFDSANKRGSRYVVGCGGRTET